MPTKKLIKKIVGSDIDIRSKFSGRSLFIVAAIFAGVGVYLLIRTFAAGPIMSLQGEGSSSTRSGNLSVTSSGSASGGSYLNFGAVESNPGPTGQKCLVRLHGKGGSGGGTWMEGDTRILNPTGNASGWGGRQWIYYPESGYQQVKSIVENSINSGSCGRVIINGFSNGAAAAAKLYCRGETFGGRMVGYIIDDPVVDHGTNNCQRPSGVQRVLYWTGALSGYGAGWNCASGDWTCEGGTLIGLAAAESNLGVTRKQSIHYSHSWYMNPPELSQWW